MEQEFNDQKHVMSVILCVCVCLLQATQQIYALKINRTDFHLTDGTICFFFLHSNNNNALRVSNSSTNRN